jgi:hypothetical protein
MTVYCVKRKKAYLTTNQSMNDVEARITITNVTSTKRYCVLFIIPAMFSRHCDFLITIYFIYSGNRK